MYEALTAGGALPGCQARRGSDQHHQECVSASAPSFLDDRDAPRSGKNPVQLSVIGGASLEVIAHCYAYLTKEDAYDAMTRVLIHESRH